MHFLSSHYNKSMIHHLLELCKDLDIDPGSGSIFLNQVNFLAAFPNDDIKSLWGDKGYVIGLIVNGTELRYPFETSDFKKLLKEHA